MDSLTVFCPFTRAWAVGPFFDALAASDVPRGVFVAYVDSDTASLARAVTERATALGFTVRDHITGMTPPRERSRHERRRRHLLMRAASRALVGDGPLLLLEDDTLIPPDTFAHLSEARGRCDWATGAEVGRWDRRPVGAWHIEAQGRLATVTSLMPSPEPEAIDAGGFYCALTTGAVYRTLDFSRWNGPMPLDIAATWGLTLAGHRLMIDWRVPCDHLMPDGSRITLADAAPYSMPVTLPPG